MHHSRLFLTVVLLMACISLLFVSGCLENPVEEKQVNTSVLTDTDDPRSPGLVFNDPEFAFELRRTLSVVYSGDADIGECLATASRIKEGDFESWYQEWNRTADHFRKKGDTSLAQNHTVSAREAYFRAATYYRTAEFFLHGNPADPRILKTWKNGRDLFSTAVKMDTIPVELVEIPFENTTLPGYFYAVDNSGTPRPLLIVQTGFDGCQEELHPYAVEGVKRGYNVLTFEGPGQGQVLRVQQIPFRSDWEKVVTPVIDYATVRSDVNENRIALWGVSLGGYLAPRAAAYDHRIAALIADAGTYDVGLAIMQVVRGQEDSTANLTRSEIQAYLLTDPEEFNKAIGAEMNASTRMRWLHEHGMYAFNASSPALFWAKWMNMTMEGSAELIRCPTLVTSGDSDTNDPNATQALMLYDHLTCPKDLVIFSDEYEAGYHCQMGAFAQSFETKFDWLDEAMGGERIRRFPPEADCYS